MVAKIKSVAFKGIDVIDVDIEVQATDGLPAFNIVGLPDKTIAESKERIRSALSAIGISMPPKRITVNLAPADVLKEGSHYDLPIILGLMAALGLLPKELIDHHVAMGELGLDGRLRGVAGILPAVMYASNHHMTFLCPAQNGLEAAWVDDATILIAPDIISLLKQLRGEYSHPLPDPLVTKSTAQSPCPDFSDIRGQETAKRAFEIAAAGNHNILMSGPPGSGKSMLASAMPSILPPLTPQEALDLTCIYSVSGNLTQGHLMQARPFRAPHHSASLPAMVGGGNKVKPGEISLAHHGILFLDELPEFNRQTLEALRQPMESGETLVARANAHITYPAGFQLVAAMNPCPCGYLGTGQEKCRKTSICGAQYTSKISGPIMDRIDMYIEMQAIPPHQLTQNAAGEASDIIQKRVQSAREKQTQRYSQLSSGIKTNGKVSSKLVEEVMHRSTEAEALLLHAAEKFNLSARSYYKVIKVAQTIADLEESPKIERTHMVESLSYRHMQYA